MEEGKTPAPDRSQRVASAVTTSALSLTLFSCYPTYYPNPQGPTGPTGPGQTPVTNPGQQGVTQYTDQQAYNKFFNNGYDYIDAKVLAGFWGESSPSAAKLRLGRKMLWHGPQDGRVHIGQARSAATRGAWYDWPVSYSDGGYTYNDAATLGAYWGQGLDNAKMKMARNLIQGNDQWTRAALNAARGI